MWRGLWQHQMWKHVKLSWHCAVPGRQQTGYNIISRKNPSSNMFLFRGECRTFQCNWNEEENKVDPTKADVCFCFITSFVELAMTKTKWLQSAEHWVNYPSLRKAGGHWVTSIHQAKYTSSVLHLCINTHPNLCSHNTRTKPRSKEKKFAINRKIITGVCLIFYI